MKSNVGQSVVQPSIWNWKKQQNTENDRELETEGEGHKLAI